MSNNNLNTEKGSENNSKEKKEEFYLSKPLMENKEKPLESTKQSLEKKGASETPNVSEESKEKQNVSEKSNEKQNASEENKEKPQKEQKEKPQENLNNEKENQSKEQKTEQKEKEPQIETPIYLQDPEKKLTRKDIEQNYKEAINAAEKIVEEFKNEFKNISEEKLLFEIRERIQKVGKYEARGNEDKIYQKLKEISQNPDIFKIPPEKILVAFDYLLDQKNKENYLKAKQQFEKNISEISKERRSLAAIVSLEGNILEVSNKVEIFEKDEKGNVEIKEEILPDLKRAEIAYKLLKEYCLDKDTKDRWQDMENKINKLLKDEKIKGLLDERLEIEKQLKEAQEKKDTEKIKSLQKEYFDISEQLKEYDELNQQLLREKYDFNAHLNNVLKNFYFEGKITNEKEMDIFEKIQTAKSLSFEKLLEASGVSKEVISQERGITEEDKIRQRLEKAGIKEISMPNIERYALEYLDLLEKRKGFISMPKEMEFYQYIFVKTLKEAKDYLEKLESKKEEEREKEEKEEIDKLKKEAEKSYEEKEEKEEGEKKEEAEIPQIQEAEKKPPEEKTEAKEEKVVSKRKRFLDLGIISEILEAMIKEFRQYINQYIKKNKDKIKNIFKKIKF
jgi:hypothetical protein